MVTHYHRAMHRTPLALLLAGALALTACSGDDTSGSATTTPATTSAATAGPTTAPVTTDVPPTVEPAALDLAGAAAAAQAAIDLGDGLGSCPWDMAEVLAVIAGVAPLVPELAEDVDNYGQVFRGGEADITYCEEYASSDATTGIDEVRVDVHPGTADLQTYLDEEFGADAGADVSTEVYGGRLVAWCLEEDRCIAVWRGDGLMVALVTDSKDQGEAADAAVGLTVALPLVVDALAA